jgi:hypothetical protein
MVPHIENKSEPYPDRTLTVSQRINPYRRLNLSVKGIKSSDLNCIGHESVSNPYRILISLQTRSIRVSNTAYGPTDDTMDFLMKEKYYIWTVSKILRSDLGLQAL